MAVWLYLECLLEKYSLHLDTFSLIWVGFDPVLKIRMWNSTLNTGRELLYVRCRRFLFFSFYFGCTKPTQLRTSIQLYGYEIENKHFPTKAHLDYIFDEEGDRAARASFWRGRYLLDDETGDEVIEVDGQLLPMSSILAVTRISDA